MQLAYYPQKSNDFKEITCSVDHAHNLPSQFEFKQMALKSDLIIDDSNISHRKKKYVGFGSLVCFPAKLYPNQASIPSCPASSANDDSLIALKVPLCSQAF